MTERPGPWQLDRVKARLRRKQVARESAASARYRADEDNNKRKTDYSDCIVCGLVLCCVLLSLSVIFLFSVVFALTRNRMKGTVLQPFRAPRSRGENNSVF
jgi:hypothetical protein